MYGKNVKMARFFNLRSMEDWFNITAQDFEIIDIKIFNFNNNSGDFRYAVVFYREEAKEPNLQSKN